MTMYKIISEVAEYLDQCTSVMEIKINEAALQGYRLHGPIQANTITNPNGNRYSSIVAVLVKAEQEDI